MHFHTRLRIKMLWLKHTYRFYWAHKPLCGRFAEDVLKLGRVYLCRSCIGAYTGILTGSLLVFLAPASGKYFPAAFPAALLSAVVLSILPLYKSLPRLLRDGVRFTSGLLVPVGISLCAGPGYRVGIPGMAILLVFWWIYLRVRKSRKLRECDGCSELGQNRICSGFVTQAGHIRKYQAEADALLIDTGYVPECAFSPDQKGSR
jgi:hypothetical protein